MSASVRAACLAANPSAEQLHVALDDTGAVLSLSYSLEGVKAAACKPSASPALPERSTVSVLRPSEGPSVLTPQALGVFEQGVFTGERTLTPVQLWTCLPVTHRTQPRNICAPTQQCAWVWTSCVAASWERYTLCYDDCQWGESLTIGCMGTMSTAVCGTATATA